MPVLHEVFMTGLAFCDLTKHHQDMVDLGPLPALLAARDWPRAERLLRRAAREKAPPAQVFYNLAKVLIEAGKAEQAGQWLRRALRVDPRYANAWFELGRWAIAQRDYAQAQDAFTRVLDLESNDLSAARNLLALAQRRGDASAMARACTVLPEGETDAARYRLAAESGAAGFAEARSYLAKHPGDLRTLTQPRRGVLPFTI